MGAFYRRRGPGVGKNHPAPAYQEGEDLYT